MALLASLGALLAASWPCFGSFSSRSQAALATTAAATAAAAAAAAAAAKAAAAAAASAATLQVQGGFRFRDWATKAQVLSLAFGTLFLM